MFAVAVSGGIVWWNRRTWLQHLAFGIGVGTASLLVLPLLPIDGPDWGAGLVLALVGVVWGALALKGWLPPENAGLLLSTTGILGGIELMAMSASGDLEIGVLAWAVWLGIAVSAALIVGGAWLHRYLVLGMGAAGLVAFAIQLVISVLKIGMGTPIAFLTIGLVLLASAAWLSLRFASAEKPATRILAEIAGYAGVAFAVAGAMTLLSQYWDQTSTAVHIGVPAVLAVVAYACAIVVERAKTDSARRLSQVLYGGAIAAVGGTAAMIVYPIALDGLGGPLHLDGELRRIRGSVGVGQPRSVCLRCCGRRHHVGASPGIGHGACDGPRRLDARPERLQSPAAAERAVLGVWRRPARHRRGVGGARAVRESPAVQHRHRHRVRDGDHGCPAGHGQHGPSTALGAVARHGLCRSLPSSRASGSNAASCSASARQVWCCSHSPGRRWSTRAGSRARSYSS